MTPDEIRQALAEWKQTVGRRDELVRLARQAGIEIMEISRLTGLSRVTVYKILGLDEDRATT
jgi:predicted transcriptional regulator